MRVVGDPASGGGARRGLALAMVGVALLMTAWVAVGLLMPDLILPNGIRPPLGEVFDLSPSPIYALVSPGVPLAGDFADLHIDVTAVDESTQLMTLRVSGHRACASSCTAEQLVLVALRPDEPEHRGLPPFTTVSLPDHDALVQATVQLPVQQRLIQYPFDSIELLLGVALQEVGTAGAMQPVPPTEAANHLRLTLQEQIAQMELPTPVVLSPTLFTSPSAPIEYVTVARLTLNRKEALKLMTILLLALITGTALYTIMLRSLKDVVLGFGGLILGVWSVRAILVPTTLKERTGVDIALLIIIVFLLVVLGIRAARVIGPGTEAEATLPTGDVDRARDEAAERGTANGWRVKDKTR